MIAVMRTGRSDKLRHLNRTHRVSIDWLHECFQDPAYNLIWEQSAKQAADIFTKAFPDVNRWRHASVLINHLLEGEFPELHDEPTVPTTPPPGGTAV